MTIKQIKFLKRLSIVYQIFLWAIIGFDTYSLTYTDKIVHPLFVILILFFANRLIKEREWYKRLKEYINTAIELQKENPNAEVQVQIIRFRKPRD